MPRFALGVHLPGVDDGGAQRASARLSSTPCAAPRRFAHALQTPAARYPAAARRWRLSRVVAQAMAYSRQSFRSWHRSLLFWKSPTTQLSVTRSPGLCPGPHLTYADAQGKGLRFASHVRSRRGCAPTAMSHIKPMSIPGLAYSKTTRRRAVSWRFIRAIRRIRSPPTGRGQHSDLGGVGGAAVDPGSGDAAGWPRTSRATYQAACLVSWMPRSL